MQSCRAPAAWPSGTTRGRLIAERANSVVWSGERTSGASLQVTVLDAEATALERARFVDGALRLRAFGRVEGLTHVEDVDEDGRWYVCDDPPAMELGRVDIASWFPAERLDFVVEVLGVLHCIHHRDLVHGALCLENLLITRNRRPILAEVGVVDVGLLAGRDGTRLDEYRAFAAPEVCHGESFDSAADLYSVGRILEYVLVGRLVELGECRTIAFGAYGESAETLAGIVARATHEDRVLRYPSAREMMRALGQVARDVRRSSGEGVHAMATGLAIRGIVGASAAEEWMVGHGAASREHWLGHAPVPTAALGSGVGRRRAGRTTARAARTRSLSLFSILELTVTVVLVLIAAAIWLIW